MANSRNPPYKWLVMIYMASNDTNSEEAAKKFLKELSVIGSKLKKSDKVKIMLLSMGNWSPPGIKKRYYSRFYEVQSNFLKRKRFTLDILNANLGDKAILIDYMARCKEKYPAEKHLLMLWGHGTGINMYDEEPRESKENIQHLKKFLKVVGSQEAPETEDERFDEKLIERQLINTTDRTPTYLFYLNVAKHRKLRWYLPNKSRIDGLRAKEIADGLKSCFRKNRGQIDIVAILGCTMQMVEFGYEIRKHCKYFVASEELMFWEGYNYKKLF